MMDLRSPPGVQHLVKRIPVVAIPFIEYAAACRHSRLLYVSGFREPTMRLFLGEEERDSWTEERNDGVRPTRVS